MGLGWNAADLHALEVLRPLLDGGYLPWTEGALRPAALAVICNEIVFGDRHEVVELGSGVSTVVLARLMRERGGRLTSVEHDPDWARVVRSQLEREELTNVVELIEGPLEPHPLAPDGAPWYPEAAVAELPNPIDLLLVDGPPGYGEGMERSRYPALPALNDHLAMNAMVVLDDATRPGERDILARWTGDEGVFRWLFSVREAEGIATGIRAIA
jgi:predicted O-methyltransferase YrrM